MAETDTLRMAAEVVDKFSPKLRALQQLLRGVHQESTKQTKAQKEGAEILNRRLAETGRSLREIVTPALTSAGLATVGFSGAIASIGAAVGSFGKATYGLDLLSKQVGITTDTIKQLKLVGEGFQIAPEAIEAGVLAFAKNMEQLRRGIKDSAKFFVEQKQFGSEIGLFGDTLRRTADNADALRKALVEMNRIPDPIQRGRFLQALGLPEELVRLYGEDIPAALAKAQAALASISQETSANAKEFERSFLDMKTVLGKFRDEAAIELMPGFTEFVKEISGGLHELGRIITGLREGKPIFAPNFLKDLITPEPGTLLGPGPKAAPDTPEAFDAFNKKMEQRRSMRIPPAAFDSYQKEKMSYAPGDSDGTAMAGGGYRRMAVPNSLTRASLTSPQDDMKLLKQGVKEGVVEGLREIDESIGGGGAGAGGGGAGGGGGGMRSGGIGAALRGIRGGGGGGGEGLEGIGGGRPFKLSQSQSDVVAGVRSAWAAEGMGPAGIAGVLGNIKQELGFNPTLRHPDQPKFGGEAHFAHGLYQEGGDE